MLTVSIGNSATDNGFPALVFALDSPFTGVNLPARRLGKDELSSTL